MENKYMLKDELLQKASGGKGNSEEDRIITYIETIIPLYVNSVKNPSYTEFTNFAKEHLKKDYLNLNLSISEDQFLERICYEYFKRHNAWSKDVEETK